MIIFMEAHSTYKHKKKDSTLGVLSYCNLYYVLSMWGRAGADPKSIIGISIYRALLVTCQKLEAWLSCYVGEYEFGGLERWNGTVEWTTGVEYWTGLLECHAHNNRSWLRVLHLWLDISLLMCRYHTVSHYSNASCITITAFAKLLI